RMGVEQVIRQAFTEAQRYRMEQDLYEEERRTNPTAVPPDYNERHEALADVLAGELLIHAHSYRADEILMLAEVLEDFGVERMTFQHANEAYKVAPELAVAGAGASVFSDWWAYKFEVYYSTAFNATILTRNGVRTSINSDSGELIRHLYHEAAKMQRYGDLSDDEALALITINPAWQLGIDDRVGSIEIGKDGDLALFDGHPLSIYAVPTHTFVDGVLEFDRTNDPDDIRLYIDPDADIEEAYVHVEQAERCLDDAHLSAGAHRHLLGGFHQH
ncbi:MAG: amidohydrolase family protein, partial [Bacteroidota bacterium]